MPPKTISPPMTIQSGLPYMTALREQAHALESEHPSQQNGDERDRIEECFHDRNGFSGVRRVNRLIARCPAAPWSGARSAGKAPSCF